MGKKILIVNFEHPPVGGGAGDVTANLAREFVARGHQVHLLTTQHPGGLTQEQKDGYTIHRVFAFRRRQDHTAYIVMWWFTVFGMVAFMRLMYRLKPDAVHVHFMLPCGLFGWIAARWFRVPVVISMHGADIPGYLPSLNGVFRLLRPLLRRLLLSANAITFPSVGSAALASESFPDITFTPIGHGIAVKQFPPKFTYSVSKDGSIRCLFASRLAYEKDVFTLMKAFTQVRAVYPKAELVVAGDGPHRADMEAWAKTLPGSPVTFLGWVGRERVREEMRQADLFLISSLRETMPIAVLQAMATGLPIIATACWGIPELITNGENGYVVPIGDHAAFAERIKELARDPARRETMGMRNAQVAAGRDWSAIAQSYLQYLLPGEEGQLTPSIGAKQPPRVVLVGAGAFGKKHLRVLKELEAEGRLTLLGVVVKTPESQKALLAEGVNAVTELTEDLLAHADAVDIVTPIETHAALLRQCLPHAHVFIEKPVTQTKEEAEEVSHLADTHGRILHVGHIYRFRALTQALEQAVGTLPAPWHIQGELIREASTDRGSADPSLEFMHLVDVLDVLHNGVTPVAIARRNQGRVHELSLRYTQGTNAHLNVGWGGEERKGILSVTAADVTVTADFIQNTITEKRGTQETVRTIIEKEDVIRQELCAFLETCTSGTQHPAATNATVGARIVGIATAPCLNPHPKRRPRVAIIGAGIFGASCAIELGDTYDVTVFERHSDIMTEASFVNQYRHHWGYHYPRSDSTVEDIRRAAIDFEARYEPAIIRDIATYYCVAREGSKVSLQAYKAFCQKHGLALEESHPGDSYIDPQKVEASFKTYEPIYDYSRLKQITQQLLAQKQSIHIQFNCTVIGAQLEADGTKTISYQENGVMRYASFDYVINSTYANHNLIPSWLGFVPKPVRVDLVEALIMRIPMPRLSFAVMDGPFTNVVPTEHDGIFTLVHIAESVLERFVPPDGLIPPGLAYKSNAKRIIEESAVWFPFLKKAELVESRFVFRSVNAHREHDDARPSDITGHGFGCWSILGGKIINAVTTAKGLRKELDRDQISKD